MSNPNLVLLIGFVQSESKLRNKVLRDKYSEQRKFYSCQQEHNLVSYVNKGMKTKLDYVAYSGNEEKSSGIFNQNGLMDKQSQSTLRNQLRATQSVIWHGVLSFEKEFGEKYVTDSEDAIRLMKLELPKFFKNSGLKPDNIVWYAGLHENTNNKHIHFSFYEKEPTRYTSRDNQNLHFSEGHISKVAMDKFKVSVEQRLTDISSQLKLARKNLLDSTKYVLFSEQNKKWHLGKVQKGLLELMTLLPKTGRLSYDSANMQSLKPKIKKIIISLVKTNPKIYQAFDTLGRMVATKDKQTKEILKSQKIDEKYWKHYLVADKTIEDIYRRLGNYVINTAFAFRLQKATKKKAIAKRYKRQSITKLLNYCLKLSTDVENEAMAAFTEHMERLEQMEQERIQVQEMVKDDYSM